jgi:hypothetical protein
MGARSKKNRKARSTSPASQQRDSEQSPQQVAANAVGCQKAIGSSSSNSSSSSSGHANTAYKVVRSSASIRAMKQQQILQEVLRVALILSVALLIWTMKAWLQEDVAPRGIMMILAKHMLNWQTSTTAAPISTASMLAKRMLVQGEEDWPPGLQAVEGLLSDRHGWVHSVSMRGPRDYVDSVIVKELEEYCKGRAGCDFNEVDEEFGTTALHMATLFGDGQLASYLVQQGADPDIVDAAGRKPSNVTFANFVGNARAAARRRGSSCELPEVHFEGEHSLAEVRRLVSEGEPVMVRNMTGWLARNKPLAYATPAAFVEAYGRHSVKASGVPYGSKFNISQEADAATLGEYHSRHMSNGTPPGASERRSKAGLLGRLGQWWSTRSRRREGQHRHPAYVFEQDGPACREGYRLLSDFAAQALPLETGGKGLMCSPSRAGLDSMHYYMGDKGTGAPFHVHSDALNLLLTGSKRWWVVPPQHATFSRLHIEAWAQDEPRRASRKVAPLECVQEAGDIMYVPFDWGHAAMNEENGVFGYTMELTNRRDTLMNSLHRQC